MGRPGVVITGIGVVAPNGVGAAEFTSALRAGRSGVRWITEFDTGMLKTHAAGTVVGFDAHEVMEAPDVRRTPRLVPFAMAAAREALRMADLAPQGGPGDAAPRRGIDSSLARDIGVTLGTGGGGLHFVEEQYRRYFTGAGGYSPFTIVAGTHGNLSSELSIQLGLRGLSHVISTGCASSTDALGYALLHLRQGTLPMMVSGGADAPITEGILRAFELMRILASDTEPPARMSRPFSRDRDGFVLGEGAWMFVLEEREHALARRATILAEVLGYASTCDAYHRVQPSPDPGEAVRAINLALADADVKPGEIEYVNLHGTSTQLNDPLETRVMHEVFGTRAKEIPMSATKSLIGHPQGACGAAGLAATILSLRNGFVHPTINLADPDPACDLDYVPLEALETHATLAVCNCIAFGSKNSALVVRVWPG